MNDEFDFDHIPVEPEAYRPETPAVPAESEPTPAPAPEPTPVPEVRFAAEPPRVAEPYQPEEPVHSAYSDAGYVPASAAPTTPRSYYCAPPAEKKPKKERRGMHWAGVVALCLVFAILGGAVVYGLPYLTGRDRQLPSAEAAAPAPEDVVGPAAGTPTDSTADTAPTVINKVTAGDSDTVTTNSVAPGQELTPTQIYYDLALKQVVGVTTEITYTNRFGYTSASAVSGSGFFISDNGYILTNYHVIEDAVKGGYDVTVLTRDGTEYVAAIVGYESDNDVAVLKVDGSGFSAALMGDSDSMLVGEKVYAVGNPLGELEYTMTDGMVSALDREITTSDSSTGGVKTINMFQISAAINEGNSGGPVYNSRGEVIGISTAKYSDTGVEGLGFAIPVNDAVKIAQDLISDGYVRGKSYMGIGVNTVTASAAQYYGLVEGAIVNSVTPGSCAETAGLKENDIIVALDGQTISSRDDLVNAKRDYRAGDSAVLRVYRGGEYLELTIVFDEATPEVTSSEETEQTQSGSDSQQTPVQPGTGGSYGNYYDFFNEFFGGFPFGR